MKDLFKVRAGADFGRVFLILASAVLVFAAPVDAAGRNASNSAAADQADENAGNSENVEDVDSAETIETGVNISGESSASDRKKIFKDEGIRKDDNVRIDVPRMPNGMPQKPVRGLSRVEKMEMDDLEYRYSQGQIGDAEYYSRRAAIMERIGLEPEY